MPKLSESERDNIILEIIRRVPVDKVAARVVSRGVHYEPNKKIQVPHWDWAPAMRFPTAGEIYNRQFVDMTGFRRGRVVAVGIYADKQTNGKQQWVVRCDCGKFTLRSSKALRNENNSQECCDYCRQILYLKRRQEYIETGRNSD